MPHIPILTHHLPSRWFTRRSSAPASTHMQVRVLPMSDPCTQHSGADGESHGEVLEGPGDVPHGRVVVLIVAERLPCERVSSLSQMSASPSSIAYSGVTAGLVLAPAVATPKSSISAIDRGKFHFRTACHSPGVSYYSHYFQQTSHHRSPNPYPRYDSPSSRRIVTRYSSL